MCLRLLGVCGSDSQCKYLDVEKMGVSVILGCVAYCATVVVAYYATKTCVQLYTLGGILISANFRVLGLNV